jgi:hypothetical protein
MKRREFLFTVTQWAAIPFGLSLLEACGGGGSGYGSSGGGGNTSQGGNCTGNGTHVIIQLVHTPNHTLTIPAADVIAGVAMLQNNSGLMEVSTLSSGYNHNVTVNCA